MYGMRLHSDLSCGQCPAHQIREAPRAGHLPALEHEKISAKPQLPCPVLLPAPLDVGWRCDIHTHHPMNAVQIQKELNANAYFDLVSFTLLFYDYFLVLDWEVSRYWGTPFTWPNVLFFANRYGTLLGNIPVVMESFWSENSTPEKIKICLGIESYHQYFIIATQLMVGAMLMLRTYALYERSKRILALLITFTVGVVAVGIWSVLSGKAVDKSTNLPLYFGCNYPISREQGLSLATAWAGVAVFDCMIFFLTLYKVFSRHRPNGTSLLSVLLRDGSVYFGVMVITNLSNILTCILGTPYTRGFTGTFVSITSSIMISRLMLNLRDPALAHMSGRRTQSTTLSTNLRFAPYLGATAPELDSDAAMDIELMDRPPLSRPLAPVQPSGGVEMA